MKHHSLVAWVMGIVLGLGLLLAFSEPATAHPTKKKRKPSKAAKLIKETRKKLDAGKVQLTEAGTYTCCVAPACDMCVKTEGECRCAVHLKRGEGVCGQCLEGWQVGKGTFSKVEAKTVKLYAPKTAPPAPEAPPVVDPLPEVRASLNQIKQTLASEGNYACCIGGGCDSCALEGACFCGEQLTKSLNTPKNVRIPKKPKEDEGVCGECWHGWHAGNGLFEGVEANQVALAKMDAMPSAFGVGTMFRQGSGTSWMPESSPMYAFMKDIGQWMVMVHPYAFSTFTKQTGPRGDTQTYSANWFMASAQREVPGLTKYGRGTLLLRGMMSLDPVTMGRAGYPLLFQTGETNRGEPLVDRQHPHNLFMELAAAYSAPISENWVASLYVAPVGEPALGPVAFPHRLSAMENPEAPLGHHWQDSTHIASGVITLGLANQKMKFEGSWFTGAEPGENRWTINRPKFDSWAGRFSFNPHRDVAMQVSYGHLREPEELEPGTNIHRITASTTYTKKFQNQSWWASTFIWGRNEKRTADKPAYGTNAFLIESNYSRKNWQSFFGRFEHVQKDELFVETEAREQVAGFRLPESYSRLTSLGRSPVGGGHGAGAPEIFPVKRLTLGVVQNLPGNGPLEIGIGTSVGLHFFPTELEATYGKRPIAFNLFVRMRLKPFRGQ
ncbi:MAG: hypothetical protein K1Y36_15815 [Blastocatellia bacterium]|nr:hypothetical protein [Blastocatellia bacterium]